MNNYIYCIALIPFYKLLNNYRKYIAAKQLYSDYFNWLNTGAGYETLVQKQPLFQKLVKDANIKSLYIPTTQPMDNQNTAAFSASVAEVFPNRLPSFIQGTKDVLLRTIGTYKMRMLETINPFYWIEVLIYLPKNILEFSGVKPEHFISKLSLIAYWLIIAFSLLKELFH